MPRTQKSWKTNTLFLIVIWLILLIASVTILSSVVTPFLKTLQTENLISSDWGGYGVSSSVLFPQPVVTAVSASWTVPTVDTRTGEGFSAAWVGIGGQSDNTLIQVGTEHDSVGGQASYSLWYELLPNDSVTIKDTGISPGDHITASVSLIDGKSNTWLIQVSDLTTGQGFSQSFNYNSSRLTGEWVIERPTVNNRISNLADFGTVTFTNVSAVVANARGTVTTFPNYQISMEDRLNNQMVKISNPSRDGSSFTVTFVAST